MTALVPPSPDRFEDWSAMIAEFRNEPGGPVYPHGSGLPPEPGPSGSRDEFDELLARAARFADPAAELPEGFVHCDYLWIVDDAGALVGNLAIRHRLNDYLLAAGGHVGYAVRPSRRREGHATAALGLSLDRCRELGIDRVLVTCEDDNLASARTIESRGGVLEDVRDGKRRYWIALS